MSTTYRAATSDMFALVLGTLPALALLLGYQPEIRWHDVPSSKQPTPDRLWMRVSRQTVDAGQSTLSTCVGEPGKVRYTEYGLVFVQLFAPAESDKMQDMLAQVAQEIRKVFRRKSTEGKVWFRNARIREIPPEAKFLRMNVVAEFEYDEIF